MKQLLIRSHLGLGDALVINAIVRHYARTHHCFVLAKPHNMASCAFMWRDLRNVETISVDNDDEADAFAKHVKERGHEVLGLGFYSSKPFDVKRWDSEMYRQAGIEFQQRWNGFVVHRQPSRELQGRPSHLALVHDDPKRGYVIDPKKLPKKLQIVRMEPGKTDCLFDWWGYMEEAQEIHCIDSSPAILVDSLPTVRAEKLVMHDYARPDMVPPQWTKNWIHIK